MRAVSLAFLIILSLLAGCAKDREVKSVIPNSRRLLKSALDGTYLYLRSLSEVNFTSHDKEEFYAPGFYLENDKLVKLIIKENSLDVVAIDPLYRDNSTAEKNNTLASFPIRHVDVLRKQNADGKDTNEEEETETRHVWQDRQFIVVDLTRNNVDLFKNVKNVNPSDITLEPNQRLQFSIQKQLQNDTLIREQYSFLQFKPSKTYEQRLYPKPIQDRFGFFKTTTYQFDPYGRMTETLKRDFMNRWDPSRQIIYYLSKNFPQHLKPMANEVFANWNRVLEQALGHSVLELRENSGQEVGDLSSNLIVYDNSQTDHNLIGYGPSVTNPRTGEIIKGDVFIYGNTLRRAIYNERRWSTLIGRGGGLSFSVAPATAAEHRLWTPLDLNEIDFKKSQHTIETNLLNRTRNFLAEDNLLPSSMKSLSFRDHFQRMTRLNDAATLAISELKDSLTDEELEIRIFTPLLTHELGHNLGLRHNFMGSVDEAHFHPTAKTSSVMDYGFFASEEPTEPAPYDAAAIKVLYGKDPKTTETLLQQHFFYCTDEQVMDSRNALCNDFDAGTNLFDITQNQMKRYAASYFFNNLRLDRVHFGKVEEDYLRNVLGYLLPIRLTFDYATSLLRYAKPILSKTNTISDIPEADLVKLWSLLKMRIEANADLPTAVSVQITPSLTVKIDPEKLKLAIQDAQRTRTLALNFLAKIVKDSERPEFDSRDPIYNDLQIRGVIYDKLVALRLFSIRLADPLGDGGAGISPFETLHAEVANLYAGILSNTETTQELGGTFFTKLHLYEPTLREAALSYVNEQIQSSTVASGELKDLLRLQKVMPNDPDSLAIESLSQLRTQYRELLLQLAKNPASAIRRELENKIEDNRKKLHAFNLTSLKARDGLNLKAPLWLSEFGNIETASGHLLQDGLGSIQDRLEIQKKILERLETSLKIENDPQKKLELLRQKSEASDLALLLARYVETEMSFAERLYRIYTPN